MLKQIHWLRFGIMTLLCTLAYAMPAVAATKTTNPTDLQGVAQTYATTKPLQQGMIFQLNKDAKSSVSLATYDKSDKTFGIVVPANATPVTLSNQQANQVYVVTSGEYNVLVSTQNGTIKAGDYIGVSAIDGIGMHADNEQASVLGRATSSFDGKTNIISTTDLKTSKGATIKAAIGTVSVLINVVANPNKTSDENGVPTFVQSIAKSLVGKPISAVQMYASLGILIAGLGVVTSLLYGGIQTGMTAIGRNPLARKSIVRNMIQVIATGLSIFFGCLVAVYLILKI